MDLETAQTNTTAKLPLLKQGEYDMWKLRIEQYFQVQDYALWDVIENGNSFKPAAQTTTNADGSSTTLIPGLVTADEKDSKKDDVKARNLVSKEDKPDLDTMSFDDLYNNFKIVEQEVKGTTSSSSSLSSQNLAFIIARLKLVTANLSGDTDLLHFSVHVNQMGLNLYIEPEQIHEDDLEEIDLKWQLALLSIRTRKVFQKTEISSKAMLANDGAGFDWIHMADKESLIDMGSYGFIQTLEVNAVKASSYWVWRPTKLNSASITFKRHNYVDARGRSKKNNMYSVDIKNIVPKESLTCLVAKATLDESMLWHRRLVMSEFCEKKGIKRKFSIARTPKQNGVAERRNMTLIEAARTMLADSKLPTTFWVEAFNTTCYVQNKVLVVKPHNKTAYELFRGRTSSLSFMRPFGCHVTILNTLDHLGKFDGKPDDGFFVGYSLNSKAFRVYNIRTRKVEENLHVRFLEDKPIIAGDGPKWLFDIDVLTKSMNYVLVVTGTNSNDSVDGSLFDSSSKNANNDEPEPSNDG
ncbi:ribonuclease H-like domain-containing protein [Tanacetum coccineum]